MRDEILESKVRDALSNSRYIGKEVLWFDLLGSTMDYAKENHKELPSGTLIVANEQRQARGRYSRKWHSPRGGAWVSYLLKDTKLENPGLISLAAGVAAYETLNEHLDCNLKWVNDVLYNDKKIGGILIEGDNNHQVIGIGLNTNVYDFNKILNGEGVPDNMKGKNLSDIATSVKIETGKDMNNTKVVVDLSRYFNDAFSMVRRYHHKELIEMYNRYCGTNGRVVDVYKRNERMFSGTAREVDDMGRLAVEKEDGSVVRLMDEEIFYI